ncbi:hypothetical protein [Lewinella sp. W8]|uniref:hypothetical protein n=1 Tax=Lewinella sp. W8 TaxID=2528208 RepID=UPI0010677F14|nr:hypothetical protein [Lewinella sp. W8]MTB51709.1 hypothetical protein [Lewinella sp. W8]
MMKFAKISGCLFFLTTLLSINFSCLPSKNDYIASPKGDVSHKIDTSLWLKETRGIRDIVEDRNRNIWFSSPDYVAMYDGQSIRYFNKGNELAITGNLHQDINGTIWVENGVRAFRYEGESFIEEKIDSIIGSGNLWFQRGLSPSDTTYTQPGLYVINYLSTSFHPFPVEKNIENKYLYFPTTKAYHGKDTVVWVGTMEKVFGLQDTSFITIGRKEMGRENDDRQMGIRGIFVDRKGDLWIADNGAGIFVFDGHRTIDFTKKYGLTKNSGAAKTLHRAFSIAEDTLGQMWLGTAYSGIWAFNPRTEEFTNYSSDQGVNSELIWTIFLTSGGELLFAGESPAAVYRFNGITFDRIF